jgi:hypothetical protein
VAGIAKTQALRLGFLRFAVDAEEMFLSVPDLPDDQFFLIPKNPIIGIWVNAVRFL